MTARAPLSRARGEEPDALIRARAWARLLDTRFRIAGIRFGLDPIAGLVPGLGDLVTLIGGIVMLASAHRLGLSGWVKAKIIGYTLADFLVGIVPVLGDVFDFAYRSHVYSLRAIERAWARQSG